MTQQLHSGVCLEKTKILIQDDPCTPVFTAALVRIAKTQREPKRARARTHTHTHTMNYYSQDSDNLSGHLQMNGQRRGDVHAHTCTHAHTYYILCI